MISHQSSLADDMREVLSFRARAKGGFVFGHGNKVLIGSTCDLVRDLLNPHGGYNDITSTSIPEK